MRLKVAYISNDQHVFSYKEAQLETDPATGKRMFEGGVFNQDGTFEATGSWDS